MQDSPYHGRFSNFASTSELTLIDPQTDPVKTASTFQSTPVAQLYEGRYLERDEGEDDESDEYSLDVPNWSSLRPARWSIEPESQTQLGQEQVVATNAQLNPVPIPGLEFEYDPSVYAPISPQSYSNFVSYNPVKKQRIPKPEVQDYRKGLEKFTSSFKVDPSAPSSTSPAPDHSLNIRAIAPKAPTTATPILPRIRLRKVAGSVTATLVFRDDDNNSTSGATATIQVPTASSSEELVPEGDNGHDNPDSVTEKRIEVEEGERSSNRVISSPNLGEKAFCCPTPGCMKQYKQNSGLLYHLNFGQCRQSVNDRFKRRIHCPNPKCQRNYATRNGLQYHLERTACREAIKQSLKIVDSGSTISTSEDSMSPSPSSNIFHPMLAPAPPREANVLARAAKRRAAEKILQGAEDSDVDSGDEYKVEEDNNQGHDAAHAPSLPPPPWSRREPEIVDLTDNAPRFISADVNPSKDPASLNEIDSELRADILDGNVAACLPVTGMILDERYNGILADVIGTTPSQICGDNNLGSGRGGSGDLARDEAIPRVLDDQGPTQMEGIDQPTGLWSDAHMDEAAGFEVPLQDHVQVQTTELQRNHIAHPSLVVKIEQEDDVLLPPPPLEAIDSGRFPGNDPSDPIDLELMYPDSDYEM